VNAARGASIGAALAIGWLSATSCGGDSEAQTANPPVFIDAASEAAPDSRSDAPPEPASLCNLASPSCQEPAAPKCTVLDTPAGYVAGCVPEYGTKAIGAACQRQALGYDDCVTGALCSSVALTADAGSELVCRKLCITPAECPAPDRCYRFSLGQPEIYGMCVAPCQPLDSDCGSGRHCIFVLDAARDIFAMCDDHGTLPEGAQCNTPQECERGMACVTNQGCRQYCNATRPCTAAGRTCNDLGIAAFPGLGVCLPG
jgi:hypothetical protein